MSAIRSAQREALVTARYKFVTGANIDRFTDWLDRNYPALPEMPEMEYPYRITMAEGKDVDGFMTLDAALWCLRNIPRPGSRLFRAAHVEEIPLPVPEVKVTLGGVEWTRGDSGDWFADGWTVRPSHTDARQRSLLAALEAQVTK